MFVKCVQKVPFYENPQVPSHIRGGERSFPYGLAIFWLDCKLFSGKLPALAEVLKAKKSFCSSWPAEDFGKL